MSEAGFKDLPPAVLEFRPNCPGCTPQTVTAADARPCSSYDCPGLPAELKVTCDLCMYDFAADDGQIKCDHSTCETAQRLKSNLASYRAWVDILEQETTGTG